MAENTPSENMKTIDKYLYSAVVANLIEKEEPDINTAEKVLHYQFPIDQNNVYYRASINDFKENPKESGLTRVIAEDHNKYVQALRASSLADILGTTLADGVKGEVKDAIVSKYGSKKFGDVMTKLEEYKLEVDSLKADYKKKISKEKEKPKKEQLKAELDEKIKTLRNDYNIKELDEISETVDRLHRARFAAYERDAALNYIYSKPAEK